jgi:hypothetical protein
MRPQWTAGIVRGGDVINGFLWPQRQQPTQRHARTRVRVRMNAARQYRTLPSTRGNGSATTEAHHAPGTAETDDERGEAKKAT